MLVINDMLGINDGFIPRFVKQHKSIHEHITSGTLEYIKEVKSGEFPKMEHTFSIDDEVIKKLY